MVRAVSATILVYALALICAPAFAADTKGLTIEGAISIAREKNPDLRILRFEEGAAKGREEQARLLLSNNPTLEGNFSKKDRPDEEGGGNFTNYGLRLSQEFEISGQRGARMRVAEKELARVRWEIRDRERLLIAEVKDAFAKVLSLGKKAELAHEIVRLNEELLGYTRIKFQAGEVSGLDVNLSEVELSKARKGLLLAEREYREACLSLQGLLGLSPDMSLMTEGELPLEAPALPAREALLASAMAQRPDLHAAGFEVERTDSALELVKREALPNVTLTGFYDRDEGRSAAGLAISIPLPIFDRKQAERGEASARADGAKTMAAGLKITIEREVHQAYSDIMYAAEELSLFSKEILARAAENLDLLNLAFKEGKIGYFEVRLAQRDTIDAQVSYIEAQTRAQLALNAVERTTGEAVK